MNRPRKKIPTQAGFEPGIFALEAEAIIVREPGGPTMHPPPPPPTGTFHYGPKMYLKVSRTQSHLFPGQPLGYTGVIALCARVPFCDLPGAD